MRNKSGFSMLELMIVVGIISILSAIAVPALIGWLPGYRLRGAVRDLQSDMQLARLRAVRENASVAMVFNTGGNSYTIFVDNGAVGGVADNWVQDGGEVRLRQVRISSGVTMDSTTFGGSRFSFNGRGLPNVLGGTVNMRNAAGDVMRIILSSLGRIRTETGP